MDQTFDHDEYQATTGGGSGNATAASGTAGSGGDLLSCLPLPPACATVIRRLRAPAMTVRYSLDKQIIPDLDAAGGTHGGTPSGRAGQGSDAQSPASGSCEQEQSGGNSAPNTMSESGSLTVRFFDLAVGGMLVAVAVCAMRCCRGMKCACRRWL